MNLKKDSKGLEGSNDTDRALCFLPPQGKHDVSRLSEKESRFESMAFYVCALLWVPVCSNSHQQFPFRQIHRSRLFGFTAKLQQ